MRDPWTEECSDAHCILRDPSKPRGLHTNGGCQHLKARSVELTRMLMALGAEIVSQRRELEAARAVVEQTKEVLADEDAYAKADPSSGAFIEAWQTVVVSRMRLDDLIKAYDAAKAGKAVE